MVRHAKRRNERGAVMVEFVFVLPFFLFLIFILISFGVLFSFRQEVSQAAGEGARAAAVAPVGTTDAVRQTRAYAAVAEAMEAQGGISCSGGALTKGGATVGSCAVTIANCPEDASTRCVTVNVTHNYRDHPVATVPQFFGFTNPETLTYSASARIS